ncbi:MAG: hypothetical protein NXI25_26000 [bacterium]|nr:hypothetical protein [bacterium]
MTLTEVQKLRDKFGDNFVSIRLTNDRHLKGVLTDAFKGHKTHHKFPNQAYFYISRVDISGNPTESYACEEIISISKLDLPEH